MLGFAAFMMIVVMGILVLVGGLQFLSGKTEETLPPGDDGRMDRLEAALSSLESRLDSLQDQQRFLERLLEQRPAPPSLPSGDAPGRSDPGDSILFDTGAGEEDQGS